MLAALAERDALDGLAGAGGAPSRTSSSTSPDGSTAHERPFRSARRVGRSLKGFLRDKASVFFAIVFPLMFLVLFGGVFADQSQPQGRR